ncbi:MAG TPA: phytanoyl-CoA dioxygenase, partial [Acidimicrobiia bacterium]|nr:phytanoyl-CoA dioxygenase [Acidimicrobiia bacterium]
MSVQASPCRAVTSEEVEHLNEFGWVKLTSFVDPEVVRTMLDIARERMGDDADSNALRPGMAAAAANGKTALSYFNAERGAGLANPVMEPLIQDIGTNAARLMPRGAEVGIRYYSDLFVPKLPSSKASK